MNIITDLLFPKAKKNADPDTSNGLPALNRNPRGIKIKSPPEIEKMRHSAKIVATVLKEIQEICASLNNEVVHGIPNRKKVIRRGDVLKVDTGAYCNGFHGDSCITIPVGNKVSKDAAKLIKVAEEALYKGIEQVKAGNHLLDIAIAVEDHVNAHGYNVVEQYTGHGVGKNLHEAPSVFNHRTKWMPNVKLKAGMTLAIEPILNAGSKHTRVLSDRWTVVTVDNNLSAQFEHTVLVTKDGYEILTDRSLI